MKYPKETPMKKILKVGDQVMLRGSWGSDAPLEAEVKSITLVETTALDGIDVPAVFWEDIANRDVVLTFTDRKQWAYGFQISPMPSPAQAGSNIEPVLQEAS
jgi:hypothetical protein